MSEVQIAVISSENTELTLAVPGHQGASGATGAGVPVGGTTGQILEKVSNTDYDTQWTDAATGNITGVTAGTGLSGGGTSGNVTLNLDASIDTLTDVDTTTTAPTDGQALAWDNANSEWIPMDMTGVADLGYIAGSSSGEVTSSTGTNATIPGFTSTEAGLAGASGGGTDNFLRADGTWSNPPGTANLTYTTAATTGTINSSTGTDATIPKFTTTDAGLVHGSGGGTANFLRADGTWNAPSTDLGYTPAANQGTVTSSNGNSAILPEFTNTEAGLVSGSGGGTTNYLRADGTWSTPAGVPAGSDTQVQFNDGGVAGGDTGLTFDKTTNALTVGASTVDGGSAKIYGDIDLDDGGSFSTTVQAVTPTANRTISFPDATGTVALVNGSNGTIQYNDAGTLKGNSDFTVDPDWNDAAVTFTGLKLNVTDGAGGSPVSASGSNLLDLQVGGTSKLRVSSTGAINAASLTQTGDAVTTSNGTLRFLIGSTTPRVYINNTGVGIGTSPSYAFHVNAGPASSWCVTNASVINLINFSDTNGINLAPGSSTPLIFTTGGAERGRFNGTGGLTLADANDIAVGTTTGTKIGTATTQKLGFYNATPVVQPTAVADATDAASVITQLNALLDRMRDLGLIAT